MVLFGIHFSRLQLFFASVMYTGALSRTSLMLSLHSAGSFWAWAMLWSLLMVVVWVGANDLHAKRLPAAFVGAVAALGVGLNAIRGTGLDMGLLEVHVMTGLAVLSLFYCVNLILERFLHSTWLEEREICFVAALATWGSGLSVVLMLAMGLFLMALSRFSAREKEQGTHSRTHFALAMALSAWVGLWYQFL